MYNIYHIPTSTNTNVRTYKKNKQKKSHYNFIEMTCKEMQFYTNINIIIIYKQLNDLGYRVAVLYTRLMYIPVNYLIAAVIAASYSPAVVSSLQKYFSSSSLVTDLMLSSLWYSNGSILVKPPASSNCFVHSCVKKQVKASLYGLCKYMRI